MHNLPYTLVTGASEGLGKALAIECARRKRNLILVALPGAELATLVDFITSQYGVLVVGIQKDLCEENSCHEVFETVAELGLQVNMLINNAGIGSTGLFAEGSLPFYERQIKLNVLATTLLTHLFLGMLKQNSPSYILNVGSLASYFPLPKKHVYGATKSFIYYFSKCLRKELQKSNVYVSVICPGPLHTNMATRRIIEKGNYLIRNSSFHPEVIAPAIIDGILHKKEVIIPGKLNKCYVLVYTLLPEFIKSVITNRSMKRLSSEQGDRISIQKPYAV